MTVHTDPTEDYEHPTETDGLSTWLQIRQLADELELRLHLAITEATDRWRALQPHLDVLDAELERSGKRASASLAKQLGAIHAFLVELRDKLDRNS